MSTSDPDWKATERLVSWLEEIISPEAVIEHNVMLPVLGQERKRQCDVVVRLGKPPRDQFFIVEVQARDSKPDINTFGGWLRKMDEVGANGMLCVSQAGFPSSIIEEVKHRVGPKVKLLTLNEEGKANFTWNQLQLFPQIEYRNFHASIPQLEAPVFEDLLLVPPYLLIDGNALLSLSGKQSETFSISKALNDALHRSDPFEAIPPEFRDRPLNVRLTLAPKQGTRMWVHVNDAAYSIKQWRFEMAVRRETKLIQMPYTKWNYTQEMHEGELAWFAKAEATVEGTRVDLVMIFVPNADGSLTAGSIIQMFPDNDQMKVRMPDD